MKRARDQKGRFIKKPKAPPLPADLVKSLGADRKAVAVRDGVHGRWVITSWRRKRDTAEEQDGRI